MASGEYEESISSLKRQSEPGNTPMFYNPAAGTAASMCFCVVSKMIAGDFNLKLISAAVR